MTTHEMTDRMLALAIRDAEAAYKRADTDSIASRWSARLESLYLERELRR